MSKDRNIKDPCELVLFHSTTKENLKGIKNNTYKKLIWINGGIMSLLKEVVIEAIRRMSESATATDIIYEIYLIENVLGSLKMSEEINVEEILKRVGIVKIK